MGTLDIPLQQGHFEQLLDSASWKIPEREALISVCLLLEVMACIKYIFLTARKDSQGTGLSSRSFACEKPYHKICKAAGAKCLPKVMKRGRKSCSTSQPLVSSCRWWKKLRQKKHDEQHAGTKTLLVLLRGCPRRKALVLYQEPNFLIYYTCMGVQIYE